VKALLFPETNEVLKEAAMAKVTIDDVLESIDPGRCWR